MKRLLFLLSLFIAPTTNALLDPATISQLADTVYTKYMKGVIESLHTQDHEEFADQVTEFKKLPEYAELHDALEVSFKANTQEESRAIAEPVILFAQTLQAKLANQTQIIADFGVTDQKLIDQLAVSGTNQIAYFEALKAYGLQHAFLYTLGELTKYQQEINQVTTIIADLLCSPFALTPAQIQTKSGIEDFDKKLSKLKKYSLIKSLQRELVQSNKLSNDWAKAEKAATNVRLFTQLLELKVTNKPAIFKKYSITDPEMMQFCDWIIDNVNLRLILTELGFKV